MFGDYTEQLDTLTTLFKAYCHAEGAEKQSERGKVLDYLNQQDMAFVQFVQVLIYIGKNMTVIEEQTKQAVYDKIMEQFTLLKGWRPKEIEISQMVFDIPLNVYLEKGIERFNALS